MILGNLSAKVCVNCERSGDVLMKAVMKLVNGPTVDNAIANPGNAISKMVTEIKDDRKLITELYLRVLSRNPSEQEINDGIEFALNTPGEGHQANLKSFNDYENRIAKKQADWEKNAPA